MFYVGGGVSLYWFGNIFIWGADMAETRNEWDIRK